MLRPSRRIDHQVIQVRITILYSWQYNIWRWKVAGAFCNPNAITLYCRKLSGVTKAEISAARAVNGTCQYPFSKSNFVTNLAEPKLSMQSSILGSYCYSYIMLFLYMCVCVCVCVCVIDVNNLHVQMYLLLFSWHELRFDEFIIYRYRQVRLLSRHLHSSCCVDLAALLQPSAVHTLTRQHLRPAFHGNHLLCRIQPIHSQQGLKRASEHLCETASLSAAKAPLFAGREKRG